MLEEDHDWCSIIVPREGRKVYLYTDYDVRTEWSSYLKEIFKMYCIVLGVWLYERPKRT